MTTDYLTAQEAADYLRSSPSILAKRRLDGPCRFFIKSEHLSAIDALT
jgi:hypothetical protein